MNQYNPVQAKEMEVLKKDVTAQEKKSSEKKRWRPAKKADDKKREKLILDGMGGSVSKSGRSEEMTIYALQ